jgi:hypothetical protein
MPRCITRCWLEGVAVEVVRAPPLLDQSYDEDPVVNVTAWAVLEWVDHFRVPGFFVSLVVLEKM